MKTAIPAIVASILIPTAVNAACVQADLTGTWQVYSSGWDSPQAYWTRCKMTINANGTMSNGTCTNSAGQSGPMTAASAILTAPSTCTYTAQFRVGGALNRVLHATLARDKNTGNGVGTFPGGTFIFSMTKL